MVRAGPDAARSGGGCCTGGVDAPVPGDDPPFAAAWPASTTAAHHGHCEHCAVAALLQSLTVRAAKNGTGRSY